MYVRRVCVCVAAAERGNRYSVMLDNLFGSSKTSRLHTPTFVYKKWLNISCTILVVYKYDTLRNRHSVCLQDQ